MSYSLIHKSVNFFFLEKKECWIKKKMFIKELTEREINK